MNMFFSRTSSSPLGERYAAEQLGGLRRHFRPPHRPQERLKHRDPPHPPRMPDRPVHPERAAPVVADDDHLGQAHRVEPGVEVAGMVGQPVGDIGLAGLAHPDQVRREAPGLVRHVRNHVPPEVGRGRVAVQEHDRDIAGPRFG